jgi:hypothetical protein
MLLEQELGTPSLRRSPRFHNTEGLGQSFSGRMTGLSSSAKSNRIRSVPSSAVKNGQSTAAAAAATPLGGGGDENHNPNSSSVAMAAPTTTTPSLGISFLDNYTDEQFLSALQQSMDMSGGAGGEGLGSLDLGSLEFEGLFGTGGNWWDGPESGHGGVDVGGENAGGMLGGGGEGGM